MHSKLAAAALLGALAAGPGIALAQPRGSTTTPAVRTDDARTSGTPVPGSNSFTEGQARSRMENAGFADVTDLNKDDQGIWRGRATRGGSPTSVALDYQGNVFGGAAAAAGSAAGSTPAAPRDGTAGNPPGIAAGRATDRTLGTNTTGANPGGGQPDGTPGNPTGTAAGRAMDRPLGTNTTGANTGADRPDGAPGNPSGTATSRAVDRAQGQATQPDGTPGNPSGTAAGRAVDRALGTNATGANPGSGNAPPR